MIYGLCLSTSSVDITQWHAVRLSISSCRFSSSHLEFVWVACPVPAIGAWCELMRVDGDYKPCVNILTYFFYYFLFSALFFFFPSFFLQYKVGFLHPKHPASNGCKFWHKCIYACGSNFRSGHNCKSVDPLDTLLGLSFITPIMNLAS